MLLAPIFLVIRGLVIFIQYNAYAAAYMNLKSVREGKDNTDGIEESKLLGFGQISHITLILLAAFYWLPAYAILSSFLAGLAISITYLWPYFNQFLAPYLSSVWNMLMIAGLKKWPSLKKLFKKLYIKSRINDSNDSDEPAQTKAVTRLQRFQKAYVTFIIPVFKYLPIVVLAASIYLSAPLFFFAGLSGLLVTYLERTNRLSSTLMDIKEATLVWMRLPVSIYQWVFLDPFSKIIQGAILLYDSLTSWARAIQWFKKPKESDYDPSYDTNYLLAIKQKADNLDIDGKFEEEDVFFANEDEQAAYLAEKEAAQKAKEFFIRNFLLVSDRDFKEYLFTARTQLFHTLNVGLDPKASIDLKMTETAYERLFKGSTPPYESYLILLQESDAFQDFCTKQAALPAQHKDAENINLFPEKIGSVNREQATAPALYEHLSKNPAIAAKIIARFVQSMQNTLVDKVKHNTFHNLSPEGILKIKTAIQIVLNLIHNATDQTTTDPNTIEMLRQQYVVEILAEMTKCTNNGVIMADHILEAPKLTAVQQLTAYLNQRRNVHFDQIMKMLVDLKQSLIEQLRSNTSNTNSDDSTDPEVTLLLKQQAREQATFVDASFKVATRGYDNNHDKAFWRHLVGPFLGLHHSLTAYDLVEKEESLGPSTHNFLNFFWDLDTLAPNFYKHIFYDTPDLETCFDQQTLTEYLQMCYTTLLKKTGVEKEKATQLANQIVLDIYDYFLDHNISKKDQTQKIITFMLVHEGFVYWDIEKRKFSLWGSFKKFLGLEKPLRSHITETEAPPLVHFKDLLAQKAPRCFPMRKRIIGYLETGEQSIKTLGLA